MSYDRRRSTPVINGTRPPASTGSISYGRLSEFQSGSEPPAVPAVDPQQVMRELQLTRKQLQQVTQEKQRLEALAQQLQQEIAAAMESVEGAQSALTRTQRQLHQISQLAAGTPPSAGGTQARAPRSESQPIPTASDLGQTGSGGNQETSGADPSYDFLKRLKRRRPEEIAPSHSPRPASTPDPSSARSRDPRDQQGSTWQAVPPPFPAPPPRSAGHPSPIPPSTPGGRGEPAAETDRYGRRPSRPRKGSNSARGRVPNGYGSYGSNYGSGGESSLPPYGNLADADLLEHLGLEPQDPSYVHSLTQKEREKQQSPSAVLWITVALLLVVGSFGAGFLVVQPFIREAETPVQPFPQQ